MDQDMQLESVPANFIIPTTKNDSPLPPNLISTNPVSIPLYGNETITSYESLEDLMKVANLSDENHVLSPLDFVKHIEAAVGSETADIETKPDLKKLKNEEDDFNCVTCQKKFKKKRYLNRHFEIHNSIKLVICEHCGKAFRYRCQLNRHKLSHSDDKNFSCHICDKPFKSKNSCENHIMEHELSPRYKCDTCKKSFVLWNRYIEHLKSHTHEDKNLECEYCKKLFRYKSKLTEHLLSHTNVKDYECTECPSSFRRKYQLKLHLNSVHNDQPALECPACDKMFKTRGHLKSHMVVHQDFTPYTCSECGRSFTRISVYKKHLSLHNRKFSSENGDTYFTSSEAQSRDEDETEEVFRDMQQQEIPDASFDDFVVEEVENIEIDEQAEQPEDNSAKLEENVDGMQVVEPPCLLGNCFQERDDDALEMHFDKSMAIIAQEINTLDNQLNETNNANNSFVSDIKLHNIRVLENSPDENDLPDNDESLIIDETPENIGDELNNAQENISYDIHVISRVVNDYENAPSVKDESQNVNFDNSHVEFSSTCHAIDSEKIPSEKSIVYNEIGVNTGFDENSEVLPVKKIDVGVQWSLDDIKEENDKAVQWSLDDIRVKDVGVQWNLDDINQQEFYESQLVKIEIVDLNKVLIPQNVYFLKK